MEVSAIEKEIGKKGMGGQGFHSIYCGWEQTGIYAEYDYQDMQEIENLNF